MAERVRQQARDPDATSLYALAHRASAPAGPDARRHNDRAAEILLAVHAEHPMHPASVHYPPNDISGREHESLEVVRAYANIAPHNPHALHMPTHIFTRLDNWDDVVQWNLKAADAALEHPAGNGAQYVSDEFPHAIEYLVYAYLQQGADDAAARQLARLRSTEQLQPTFKTAFHVSSIPARYVLERHAWEEAALLVARPYDGLEWDRFPWPEGVTWFARGLGAAHLGQASNVDRARARLAELEEAAGRAGEELFTRQLRVLRLAVSAWQAHMQGEDELALDQTRAAAELEASTPKHAVTPAPTLPADELLGDLLTEQGRPEEALAAMSGRWSCIPTSRRRACRTGRGGRGHRKQVLRRAGGHQRPGIKSRRSQGSQRPGRRGVPSSAGGDSRWGARP